MAQPLLETGEQGALVRGFDIDHPVRIQPRLCQAWGEQVRPRQTPQGFADTAPGDACGEQHGGGTIARGLACRHNLMQRAKQQPTAGQGVVHRRMAERQHAGLMRGAAFDPGDARAQILDGGMRPQIWVPLAGIAEISSLYVLIYNQRVKRYCGQRGHGRGGLEICAAPLV